jgi:hypothetical protein
MIITHLNVNNNDVNKKNMSAGSRYKNVDKKNMRERYNNL